MNPRITEVTPNADHTLTLTFANGEIHRFDLTPISATRVSSR